MISPYPQINRRCGMLFSNLSLMKHEGRYMYFIPLSYWTSEIKWRKAFILLITSVQLIYHVSKLSDVVPTEEDPFGLICWEKLESHDNGRKIRINFRQEIKLSGSWYYFLAKEKNVLFFFFSTSLWLISCIIGDNTCYSWMFLPW